MTGALLVMEGGRIVGIFTVKDIISEQRFIIDQLEHHLRGER